MLPLGTRVTIVAELRRVNCQWVRSMMAVPVIGIVVGYRNRHDGHMEYDYDDFINTPSRYYVSTRGFQTALVAYDLTRKLLVVNPDDMRVA